MVELEVEPVDRIDDIDDIAVPAGIDGPEYVLYGGKGGVGKTTMAAATGLASAAGGTPTLVVSTDPAHSLSDAFQRDVPTDPGPIDEDIPLYAAEIDPDAALDGSPSDPFAPFGSGSGPFAGFDSLFGDEEHPLGDVFGGPMPGSDEVVAMRQLLRFIDDERFDRVVIDTAPTGHTLRLLQLPELMDSMLGRMVTVHRRIQDVVGGMKGLFTGGTDDARGIGGEELERLRERIERLRAVLQDPDRSDFRIVVVPEEMSVIESQRLLDRLEAFDIPVSTVVVNRVMENLGDVTGVDPDLVVSPDIEGCAFCRRRWNVQQGALRSAQDLFRGHDVKRVPLFADEVRGMRMLSVVATCLE